MKRVQFWWKTVFASETANLRHTVSFFTKIIFVLDRSLSEVQTRQTLTLPSFRGIDDKSNFRLWDKFCWSTLANGWALLADPWGQVRDPLNRLQKCRKFGRLAEENRVGKQHRFVEALARSMQRTNPYRAILTWQLAQCWAGQRRWRFQCLF